MAREGLSGVVDRNGKGDKRRPQHVDEAALEANGARTFGEEWLIPPVLRRRQSTEEP